MRQIPLALLTIILLVISHRTLAQDWIYQVEDGDNIWNLCLTYSDYKNCWLQLGDYNALHNHDRLEPGSNVRVPIHWLRTIPEVGRVRSVMGEVIYQSYAGQPTPLLPGQPLGLGATLTSREGNATIEVGEHSTILLRPNTVIELDSLSSGLKVEPSSELKMPQGAVEVQVQPEARSRFEIRTPAAVAAVRGTCFRVSAQSVESMRGEVTCGLVSVTADTTVDVPAGYGVQARTGEVPSAPRELLLPPDIDKESANSPLPVTVLWSAQSGAVAWKADIYEPGDKGRLLHTYQLERPTLHLADFEQGCYRMLVRGIDAEGFNGMDGEGELCVLSPPPVEDEPRSYLDFGIWSVLTALMFL